MKTKILLITLFLLILATPSFSVTNRAVVVITGATGSGANTVSLDLTIATGNTRTSYKKFQIDTTHSEDELVRNIKEYARNEIIVDAGPTYVSDDIILFGLAPITKLVSSDLNYISHDIIYGPTTATSVSLDKSLVTGGIKRFIFPNRTGTALVSGDTLTGDVTATFNDSGATSTTIGSNTVALGFDTTGSFAAGDAEFGAATSGDSATSFFPSGAVEATRGGTGVSSGFNHGFIPIGNSSGFTMASIVSGSNVTVTNTAGSISIAATAGSTNTGGVSGDIQFNMGATTFGGTSGVSWDNAAMRFAQGVSLDMGGISNSATSGFKLPQSNALANVSAEGAVVWHTSRDTLNVGSGTATTPVGIGFLCAYSEVTGTTTRWFQSCFNSAGVNGTESTVDTFRVPYPVTCRNARFEVNTAPGGTARWEVSLRKNGASTDIVFVVSGAATRSQDTTHVASFDEDDRMTFGVQQFGSPSNSVGETFSVQCYATSDPH